MTLRVNQTTLSKAETLISKGKIDATSLYMEADALKYKHLAEFVEQRSLRTDELKGLHPCIDDGKVYRRELVLVKARASVRGETVIAGAADSLLQAIDKKLGKENTNIDEIVGDLTHNNMRVDVPYDDDEDYMEEPFVLTPEGYLKGRAIFTNIGVFQYRLEDGSVRGELRPPQEVFNYESVRSFQLLPMTNNHPRESVSVFNIKDVQVGYVGEDTRTSPYHLSIPIVLTDREIIDACQEGKRALSAGYRVDLEMTAGVWMGVPYDAIQRNIRGNHIAIVDRGRAGDDAVMKFDSADSVGILQNNNLQAQNLNNRRRDSMSLKKIRIDNVEYEADQKIIDLYTDTGKELEKVKADNATVTTENQTISAERDQFKEENTKLKADKEAEAKIQPEVLEKAVQERLVVLDAAKRADIKITDDMSESDIKKAVVISVSPTAKEKLDECTEAYLQARFDGTIESLETLGKRKEELKKDLAGDTLANEDKSSEKKNDSATAYEKMCQRMTNASKRKEEEN